MKPEANMSGGTQITGRSGAIVRGLAFGLAAVFAVAAGPSMADDLFGGLPAIDTVDLNAVTTIDRSIISTQEANLSSSQHDNSIEASGDGSSISTGAVAGNVIMNNRGITTSINNSGNNVSVNNATIVNVILDTK